MVEKSAFEVESQDVEMTTPHDPLSQSVVDNDYGFQQSIGVHTGCVRSLGTHPSGDVLMSGSIDMTNKIYKLDPLSGKYSFTKEVKYHEGFVLNIIPTLSGEGFFSAGRDGKIIQIDIEGNPVKEFVGHTAAVNSLSQAFANELVSGSWDGTAKKWDVETGEVKETMDGHTHAVSVLTLQNGITITGSQDKKIRLWHQGAQDKEFDAHEDIVRGFTEVPNLHAFASISNDEKVKLWALDGTALATYDGHQGFVFAIDTLETGEIVSGGDDCTVKVWKDGACKQSIQLPRTVWAVTHNKFGDLIVGCEDKKIYTFTRDEKRQDKGVDFTEYENACKGSAVPQGPNLADLKEFSTEILGKVQGTKEGEIKVFKDQGIAKAYMWKVAEAKWEEIGEVVNPDQANQAATMQGGTVAPGANQPRQYPGDSLFPTGLYDHIFDVDLGDNVMRQLPFNNGSPFIDSADRFCARENLSRSFTEQIVNFLKQNGLSYKTRDYDGSEAAAEAKKANQGPTCKVIPFTKFLYYEGGKMDAPQKKILEFNTELGSLTDKDLIYFESLIKVLSAPQFFHSSEVSPQQIDIIKKIIAWPIAKVFPCLDLYRVFLIHPNSVENYNGADAGAFYISALLTHLGHPDASKAVKLLGLRCLANLFRNQSSSSVALKRRQIILDAIAPYLYDPVKNTRQAAITCLLNYSIEFLTKDDEEGRIQAISALSAAIENETDLQNLLRMATTLGNLCHKNETALEMAQGLGIAFPDSNKVQPAPGEADVEKNKTTIAEIKAML